MIEVSLRELTWEEWRGNARRLLLEGVHPSDIQWVDQQKLHLGLKFDTPLKSKNPFTQPTSPAEFLNIGARVAYHRDESRWSLLYSLIWRLQSFPELLKNPLDPQVQQLYAFLRGVNFDAHKLKAYVRFRKTQTPQGDLYRAWHRSEHRVLRLTAPFFVRRFSTLKWVIATPDETATWNGVRLAFSEGVKESPSWSDDLDEMWLTYYGSTFNPSRLKTQAMLKEMPRKYWHTMPETKLIPGLVAKAVGRMSHMIDNGQSIGPTSNAKTLQELTSELSNCRSCEWIDGCRGVVTGQGPENARMLFVGEQPGDKEDEFGEVFVGPAGRLLNEALHSAKIDRESLYITNAVKHFKHRIKKSVRLHERPNRQDIATCNPWLKQEIKIISPKVIVCLGSSAAQAVLGRKVLMRLEQGNWHFLNDSISVFTTLHPAAILRVADPLRKKQMMSQFVANLAQVTTK